MEEDTTPHETVGELLAVLNDWSAYLHLSHVACKEMDIAVQSYTQCGMSGLKFKAVLFKMANFGRGSPRQPIPGRILKLPDAEIEIPRESFGKAMQLQKLRRMRDEGVQLTSDQQAALESLELHLNTVKLATPRAALPKASHKQTLEFLDKLEVYKNKLDPVSRAEFDSVVSAFKQRKMSGEHFKVAMKRMIKKHRISSPQELRLEVVEEVPTRGEERPVRKRRRATPTEHSCNPGHSLNATLNRLNQRIIELEHQMALIMEERLDN